MVNNVRLFINLRNKFEELTEIKYKNFSKNKNSDDISMDTMIRELSTITWSVYDKEFTFINYCRKKRNLIQHGNYEEEYNIYTDDFIDAFKQIVEKAKPISVYKKSVHPVEKRDINDTISKVLKDMAKNDFTHMPIMENNKLVWIISETSLVRYLAEHENFLLVQWQKISEIRELIDLKYSKGYVEFVAKDTDYDIAVNKFIKKFKDWQKLSCLLVTENWKEDEWILWILTTRDIIWAD